MNKKRGVLAIIILVVIVALSMGCYFLFSQMNNDTTHYSSSSNSNNPSDSSSSNNLTQNTFTKPEEGENSNRTGITPIQNTNSDNIRYNYNETTESIDLTSDASEVLQALLNSEKTNLSDTSMFSFPLPTQYQTGDNYAYSCEKAESLKPLFVGRKCRDPQILSITCLMNSSSFRKYRAEVQVEEYDRTGIQQGASQPDRTISYIVDLVLNPENKILYLHY